MPWIVCGLLSSGWSRASDCPVIPVFSLGQGLTSVLLTCGVRPPFAVRLSWMFSTVPRLNASDTSPSAKQKCSQVLPNMSWGIKLYSPDNHWSIGIFGYTQTSISHRSASWGLLESQQL